MTGPKPVACSLSAGDLRKRLDDIAEVGVASLISGDSEDSQYTLRFRPHPPIHRRLEEIVAAEAECRPFLDLALEERGGELVLTISAPQAGQPVADELASAFAGARA